MNSKRNEAVAKIMALKLIAKEVIAILNNEDSLLEIKEPYEELKIELLQLQEENENLKKELREYEILVNCSDLENFNPANFQKGDDDEDNTNDFTHNFN